MSVRRAMAALLATFAILTAATAQEKYTLKTSRPDKVGDRTRVTKTENMRTDNKVLDETGQAVESQSNTQEISSIYVEKILQVNDQRATKSSRTYEKAVKKVDGEAKELGLDGKTVICDWTDKKARFTYDDGSKLTDAALDLLHEEFKDREESDDIEKLFLPSMPVAVGESWKCDVKKVVERMMPSGTADAVDVANAKGSGTLRKVYKKGAATFGIIDVTLDLPLVSFGEPGDMVKADPGSKMSIQVTLDACIDGTQTAGSMVAKVRADISGSIEVGGQKVNVKAVVAVDATETQSPAN